MEDLSSFVFPKQLTTPRLLPGSPTFGSMLLALLHLNEFFPDPPGGINQLVEPLELHRILRLLVVGLFARLLQEREKGESEDAG